MVQRRPLRAIHDPESLQGPLCTYVLGVDVLQCSGPAIIMGAADSPQHSDALHHLAHCQRRHVARTLYHHRCQLAPRFPPLFVGNVFGDEVRLVDVSRNDRTFPNTHLLVRPCIADDFNFSVMNQLLDSSDSPRIESPEYAAERKRLSQVEAALVNSLGTGEHLSAGAEIFFKSAWLVSRNALASLYRSPEPVNVSEEMRIIAELKKRLERYQAFDQKMEIHSFEDAQAELEKLAQAFILLNHRHASGGEFDFTPQEQDLLDQAYIAALKAPLSEDFKVRVAKKEKRLSRITGAMLGVPFVIGNLWIHFSGASLLNGELQAWNGFIALALGIGTGALLEMSAVSQRNPNLLQVENLLQGFWGSVFQNRPYFQAEFESRILSFKTDSKNAHPCLKYLVSN